MARGRRAPPATPPPLRDFLRIGDHKRVDPVRCVAWLVHDRHSPKAPLCRLASEPVDLSPIAAAAAALVAAPTTRDGERRFSHRQGAAIAAILSEPTLAPAAAKVGVAEATLYRWMDKPEFRDAVRRAGREVVEAATARSQAACGMAVDALMEIARSGRRDGDRIRAANSLLNHGLRGLTDADLIHGSKPAQAVAAIDANDVVQLLAARLRQIDEAELPAADVRA